MQRKPKKNVADDLKARLETDENWFLKITGEVGDISRLVLKLIDRIDKLENKINNTEKK